MARLQELALGVGPVIVQGEFGVSGEMGTSEGAFLWCGLLRSRCPVPSSTGDAVGGVWGIRWV